jgi:sialic acid synthase
MGLDLTQVPLIISTGMTNMRHVRELHDFLLGECGRSSDSFALLQCTSAYPTQPKDANLAVLKAYKDAFPSTVIGYSGHEDDGHVATLGAVALGAKIIERHFTLDKSMKGSDHRWLTTIVNNFSRQEPFILSALIGPSQKG